MAAVHFRRAFIIPGERPAGTLEEVLARMEGLGAVAGECEAERRTVGDFSGHLICWHVHENTVARVLAESAWRCGVLRQVRFRR